MNSAPVHIAQVVAQAEHHECMYPLYTNTYSSPWLRSAYVANKQSLCRHEGKAPFTSPYTFKSNMQFVNTFLRKYGQISGCKQISMEGLQEALAGYSSAAINDPSTADDVQLLVTYNSYRDTTIPTMNPFIHDVQLDG